MVMHFEVSKMASGGVLAGLAGGAAIGTPPIVHFGNQEQKQRWLPGIFKGTTSFCLGATEPTGEKFWPLFNSSSLS